MTATAFDQCTYSAFPAEKYQRFLDTYVVPYAGGGIVGQALDLGCGSGGMLERLLALYPGDFVGADISRASIEACRSRATLQTDRVRFVQLDIAALDQRDELHGAFDLVTSYSVLHFVPGDTASKFRTLARLTKPGAIIAADALAAIPWNRAMFGLVRLLIRTGLWKAALAVFAPIVGPTFPKSFMEELSRMTYLRELRFSDFLDLSYLESDAFRASFELLRLDVVPQDGFLTGRKARFAIRRLPEPEPEPPTPAGSLRKTAP